MAERHRGSREAGRKGVVDLNHEAFGRVVSDLVEANRLAREKKTTWSIEKLLRHMVERHASDLHIKAGNPPGLRVDGTLKPVGDTSLTATDTIELVRQLLPEDKLAQFEEEGDLDCSYSLEGVSRFRVNVLTQRGSAGMVIRRIPSEIPTLDDLGMPAVCRRLADKPRGLVLVTGPTGSGKSTTLAAMVDHINATRSGHIVTMEDPIEFVHEDKRSWVTQREIGSDSQGFRSALRRALRQDPDVILVGEMRDFETIGLAVTAAETGHLVFGTLHTTSAVQTISRIVDVFPPEQQQQIRMQLADTIQGIICQTLLPKMTGRGRVAAMEILVVNDGIRALIREGKGAQVANMIQTGGREGMLTLESSLNQLLARREISLDTALAKANNPSSIHGAGPIAPPPKPASPPAPAGGIPRRSVPRRTT
jgi:twitching motility protein PilT